MSSLSTATRQLNEARIKCLTQARDQANQALIDEWKRQGVKDPVINTYFHDRATIEMITKPTFRKRITPALRDMTIMMARVMSQWPD